MAETFRKLAQGRLQATPTLLYTPSAGVGIIRSFRLLNLDTVQHTVALYQDGTDAAHRIEGPGTLQPGGSADDDGLTIVDAGGHLYGSTDAANAVNYTLYGIEEV